MPHDEQILAIVSALERRQAILFVGAGISMSVGLPSWTCLIDHMLTDLGLPSSFAAAHGTTYQEIAEYYRLKHGSLSQLVEWMKCEWQILPEQLRTSELHRLIVELDFPLVYTTNYDANLEMSYETFGRPFTRITSAKDMATAPVGKTQIVKYHGDFSDPDTLVLTESDYFDRLSFDAPLDIKFRSDAFASTLLFIGYSMSDLNIRFLLHHLWSTWRRTGLDRHRPPLFLFMHEPTEVQVHVLKRWGVTVLSGDGESSGDSLSHFLERLLQRRNAKARS
ncbi:SIR2 family protein [Rhizobium laguerreae]|uniref:SIR2 family protein n=1 Tax=Rhizobium laguerreae TaxID=1076926 RepID=UPI001C90E724|nr:SIR2 family protein [Rhizobium laguerreae]MBY3383417.1 Sir2 family NAD-dependent protein deacetylase [Rhizobium laguerreae]